MSGKNESLNLQSMVDDTLSWCKINKVELNPKKCREFLICY